MGGLDGIVMLLVNKFKFQMKHSHYHVSDMIMAVLYLWVLIKREALTFASV